MTMNSARVAGTLGAAALLLGLAACGDAADTASSDAVTVENCGQDVSFDAPPERVTLLKSASVPTLDRLGVLDRVTARAGVYPPEYYDASTLAQLDQIPLITDRLDDSGHLQISREEVTATAPDLVLGETDTVNRQVLSSSNIPLLEEPALCGSIDGPVTWEHVWSQIDVYGTVFGRQDEASTYIAELRERLAAIEAEATDTEPFTVAVLYPSVGGGTTYAYGTGSMSHPVIDAAGGTNVFADQDQRVFEVSSEEIVNRNPDVVIALHSSGTAASVRDAVLSLPGFDRTTAGHTSAVLPLLLNFAEPPTPLAVDGAEKLSDYIRGRHAMAESDAI
ncbi:ABC transporter substrate-binding protein [Corynebacterium sputi]|uniref:ABC transporter substrate-binding protein n=1 Tax=Corynebacterium sputi TaxID=489915 RepID=UPI0003FD3867|nr:ABC transporter substrate-binding protein [Corynebacterium sputi]